MTLTGWQPPSLEFQSGPVFFSSLPLFLSLRAANLSLAACTLHLRRGLSVCSGKSDVSVIHNRLTAILPPLREWERQQGLERKRERERWKTGWQTCPGIRLQKSSPWWCNVMALQRHSSCFSWRKYLTTTCHTHIQWVQTQTLKHSILAYSTQHTICTQLK